VHGTFFREDEDEDDYFAIMNEQFTSCPMYPVPSTLADVVPLIWNFLPITKQVYRGGVYCKSIEPEGIKV
jgi:hypothetical protein